MTSSTYSRCGVTTEPCPGASRALRSPSVASRVFLRSECNDSSTARSPAMPRSNTGSRNLVGAPSRWPGLRPRWRTVSAGSRFGWRPPMRTRRRRHTFERSRAGSRSTELARGRTRSGVGARWRSAGLVLASGQSPTRVAASRQLGDVLHFVIQSSRHRLLGGLPWIVGSVRCGERRPMNPTPDIRHVLVAHDFSARLFGRGARLRPRPCAEARGPGHGRSRVRDPEPRLARGPRPRDRLDPAVRGRRPRGAGQGHRRRSPTRFRRRARTPQGYRVARDQRRQPRRRR